MLFWAAACSDTPSDPLDAAEDAQLNFDVAAYAADQAVDDIAMMTYETAAVFSGPMASPPGGGMHGFGFEGSLSVTREVTFYDADGNVMDHYQADTTDAIDFYFLLEGDRTRTTPRGTMTMELYRKREFTVSELEGAETERQWDGVGESSKEKSFISDERGDRYYEMSSTSTVTAVLIPVPRAADSWPLSGTIERIVEVDHENPKWTSTRERTVLITFNGTNLVPIEINGVTYTFDLATRQIVEDTPEG
jgi:hypothetical protein